MQRELISGHRSNALAGIPGLKRALCALHGTTPVTRLGDPDIRGPLLRVRRNAPQKGPPAPPPPV